MATALQNYLFKSEQVIMMGLRFLKTATPFIIGILVVGLLVFYTVSANTLNRGKEKREGILTKIPTKMPPLPKNNKAYHPIVNKLITHDSTTAR